jgi:lipopolysaccharide transport system ATP-binding protein
MTAGDTVIRVEGVGKRYRLDNFGPVEAGGDRFEPARRPSRFRRWNATGPGFWALRGIDFEVERGEVVGVIGANGAGKSTLLKILSQITDPTEGRVVIRGRLSSLLEVGTGFHPELSGRENIYLNGAILGMRRAEIKERFADIVEFSGIERFIETPVKFYSSGMYVRLAFAVAAHLDPDILLVDEVLAVGDLEFQRRCLGRMDEVAHSGRTILFVSHNLTSVAALCTRGVLLEEGRVVADGPVTDVLQRYVASTEHRAANSVRERVDRRGSGALRFVDVSVEGPAGPLVLGEDAAVEIAYESSEPLRNVMVSLAVYGPMGEVVFHCSNRITGQELERVPSEGVFRCSIPRLPLLPGRYSLNLYAEVQGLVADWLEGAAVFDVLEGDFFGSGRLPEVSHGRVVIDHSWMVVDRGTAPVVS